MPYGSSAFAINPEPNLNPSLPSIGGSLGRAGFRLLQPWTPNRAEILAPKGIRKRAQPDAKAQIWVFTIKSNKVALIS